MAKFLPSQSKKKNIKPKNKPCDKKGDKNRKNGDEAKLEDKDNNNTGTAGAYVWETAAAQDSSTTSNGSSIGAHVSDVTKTNAPLTRSIQDLLAAHPVEDQFM